MIKNFLISVLILILLGLCVFVGIRTHKSKEKVMDFNGTERRYRIHLPKDYQPGTKYPLVVALHGVSFGARIMELNTGFSRLADKEGFIVVYPYGTRANMFSLYSWDSKFCCKFAFEKRVDDVGFVASVMREVIDEYSVDADKVYLTGHSNGGMLAHLVALKHPDKVKALAVVSSAIGGTLEKDGDFYLPEKTYVPTPIMIINSKEDPFVPFGGGNSAGFDIYSFSSAYDTVNFWLENNDCQRHPAEISNQDIFSKEVYNECKDGAEVVMYAYNGGHAWPGSAKEFFKNISGKSVNATELIWEFFKSH